VEWAVYPGRSADVIVAPHNLNSREGTVFFQSNKDLSVEELEEKDLANLVCDAIGVSLINEHSQSKIPHGSAFDKSKANLFVVVDTSIDLYSLDDARVLNQGNGISLAKSAYPEDNIASIATMVTGTTPSVHGIVGRSWVDYTGRTHAYRAGATPDVASFVDIVSQSFQGRSLTISASSFFPVASALGVHQYIQNEHSTWNNFAFYWNRQAKQFQNVYHENIIPELEFTIDNILASLSSSPYKIGSSPARYDVENEIYTVHLPKEDIDVELNLHSREDFALFGELHFVSQLIKMLETSGSELNQLVNDQYPDLFNFGFTSVKMIQRRYGSESMELKAAVLLIDDLLSTVVEKLNILYGGKVTSKSL